MILMPSRPDGNTMRKEEKNKRKRNKRKREREREVLVIGFANAVLECE